MTNLIGYLNICFCLFLDSTHRFLISALLSEISDPVVEYVMIMHVIHHL